MHSACRHIHLPEITIKSFVSIISFNSSTKHTNVVIAKEKNQVARYLIDTIAIQGESCKDENYSLEIILNLNR
jgi:hypothetical protein